MAVLLDTNILVRLADDADPDHSLVLAATGTLEERGESLCVASQNCIELWNVVTRPRDKNGLGQTPELADEILREVEKLYSRLPGSPAVYPLWRDLVVRFEVSGTKVHDARLVAIMLANHVLRVLTLNDRDFRCFEPIGIRALHPRDV